MAFPLPLPLVVPVAEAPIETPVEASPVVDFPVEAGFLFYWIKLVEILSVPGMSASASSPASLGLRVLLLAVVEQAQ